MISYPAHVRVIRPYKMWDVGDKFSRTHQPDGRGDWYLLDKPHSWDHPGPLSEYEVRRYFGVFFAEDKAHDRN